SRATASRSGRAPHVTAYWLMSALMAAHAASLITSGAGKSGKPCDRLTPPCRSLSRVISRMTDSVNCVAFLDPVSFDIGFRRCLLFLGRRLLRGHRRHRARHGRRGVGLGDRVAGGVAVQPAIVLRRPEDALHVALRL